MMFPDSLSDVIQDPDFTSSVTVRHDESADVDDDGNIEFQLSDPESIELLICTPVASPFEVNLTGQTDDIEYAAVAMHDTGVREDDRIAYDDAGFGPGADYRVVEVKPTEFDGDRFAWYRLIEDERGEPVGDGSDGGGGIR